MADAVLDEDCDVKIEYPCLKVSYPRRICYCWKLWREYSSGPSASTIRWNDARQQKQGWTVALEARESAWSACKECQVDQKLTDSCPYLRSYGGIDCEVCKDCDRVHSRAPRVVIANKQTKIGH
eukprot:COSAG02_NODE_286_length_25649_cov_13.411272_9_plen_124_part_00